MKIVSTTNAPSAIGPYSQAIISGGMVYTSGQIEEQTHRVCQNVKAVLEASGSSLDKVVKTVCFLADMNDFATFNGIYAQYFTSKPARSCVAVKTLPKNVLVEIDTVAEV